jgi:Mannosyltransferase (PIG-V)
MLAAIRRQASPLHTHVPVERAYNGTTDLLFGTFDRWDAENFIHIARHGYDTLWAAAFFPLFPLALAGGRPWLAALAGALAVGVRSLGYALIVPLVYLLWPRRRGDWWRPLPSVVALPAAVGAIAGVAFARDTIWTT